MPKTKAQKVEIVDKMTEKIKKAKVLVFTSFNQRGKKGLNFSEMEKLKKDLKNIDAEYVVLKKTLLNLALKKFSFSKDIKTEELDGSVAVLLGYKDMIEPMKILYKLSKSNEALLLYLGLVEEDPEGVVLRPYGASKKIISREILIELATLPSKEVLIGRAVGVIRYPLSGLVNALQGNIRGLVGALTALQVKS